MNLGVAQKTQSSCTNKADLCAAHNLLAPDSDWLDPPDVTYIGPAFDPEANEAESDLDTQYMSLVGTGVPVSLVFCCWFNAMQTLRELVFKGQDNWKYIF